MGLSKLPMTSGKLKTAIWTALFNDETMPKEAKLQEVIDKKANLVISRNEALQHEAAESIIS